MQIHQIVHHPALQVVLYPVDDDLTPNIDDLAVCHIRLVLVQCLVDPLIHLDSLSEILRCRFRVLSHVVWARRLHLHDVRHNQLLIIALGLNEQGLNALGVAALLDPTSPRLGAVRRIEDGNQMAGGAEPMAHVIHRGFGGCFA